MIAASVPTHHQHTPLDDDEIVQFILYGMGFMPEQRPAARRMDDVARAEGCFRESAELARKMVETGDWLMPQVKYGAPWWSKPPLSIWLTASSFVAFGVNAFAAPGGYVHITRGAQQFHSSGEWTQVILLRGVDSLERDDDVDGQQQVVLRRAPERRGPQRRQGRFRRPARRLRRSRARRGPFPKRCVLR